MPQENPASTQSTPQAQRLAALEAELHAVRERLAEGDAVISALRKDLAENTRATQRTETNIAEMVEFFTAMKGAFRVLNWIGALAKPITALIALAGATWAAFLTIKGGGPPK
jgi:uncharacterized coiled-coil protein SlyX